MMKQKTSTVMLWVPLVAWLACDVEDETHDRDLVIVTAGGSDGGGDGGDEGSDEAEAEWEAGEALICEVGLAGVEDQPVQPLEGEEDGLVLESAGEAPVDGELDEWTDAADVAAGMVACPMSGVASVKYIDHECDDQGKLKCQYLCECNSTYASPCNPPHPNCGPPDYRIGQTNTHHDLGPKAYCIATAWAYCRKQTSISAINNCTDYCKAETPVRKRDCPGCAAK